MIKISPNLFNFLVLTSGIKIKVLLFFVKVTGNIALRIIILYIFFFLSKGHFVLFRIWTKFCPKIGHEKSLNLNIFDRS